jgi:cyclic pyranopterin phosphate synthase
LLNPKLIDKYNRHLNYLRISITDRCNLNCIYCAPHGHIPRLHHDEILRYEEILRIVKVGVDLGISKIRVTGGEPLVRKGVCTFLGQLTKVAGLSDVALTTNGALLRNNVEKIKSAGIKRINISLDTLDRQKFAKITGSDRLPQVWQGIELAHQMGIKPIKLNVVALRGINEDELTAFAQLSFSYPFHIRFIEYMPIGKSLIEFRSPLLVHEIKDRINSIDKLIAIENDQQDGPAERFKFKGAKGEIGFIGALSHHFCNACNRLRLTASGQLRPCLLADRQLDLKGPLRKGCSDEELADKFVAAVKNKPSDHNLAISDPAVVSCQMSSIGG